MDIHRPGPQAAAARQGQAHRSRPAEQRRQIEHRTAHGPGQRGRDLAAQVRSRDRQGTQVRPMARRPGAHGGEQGQAGIHVGQFRHAAQAAGAAAQQRGRQQRQHAVFRGGRANVPLQRLPPGDRDRLHDGPLLHARQKKARGVPRTAALRCRGSFPAAPRCCPVPVVLLLYILASAARYADRRHNNRGWICTPRRALSSVSGSWAKSLFRLQGFL